jgi:tripartite-type tricarboxylate transporter receptor subunit TctC
MPDVPTVQEAGAALGLKSFDISTWFGLFAPAGLAADVTARLNKAFVDALGSPEVKARMATLMAEPAPMTSQQFGDFVRAELQKYQGLVKASGARAD